MNTSDFFALFSNFFVIMTTPTLRNFMTIATGWLLTHRHRLTDALVASGVAGLRHHAAFHRVFAAARWSLDELGLAVFSLVLTLIREEKTISLALDDTLARKRGRKVFGVGMHHDPLLSSRKKAIVNWGHSWVVMGVLVELPFRKGHWFCLPILFRLYRNKKTVTREKGDYKTRPELAVEMLKVLGKNYGYRRFHLVADSAYCGKSVVKQLPENCGMTGRVHLDAALYTEAPKQTGKGRPRKKGERLVAPRQMLQGKTRRLTVDIYGRRETMKIAEKVCLWYSVAGVRKIKIVAVKPMTGGRKEQAFFSTDLEATAETILAGYSCRWAVEVAFQDTKGHLGFEEPQGWSRKAVERTAPTAMLLYSLVLVWFSQQPGHKIEFLLRPWYRQKREICFADILRVLRKEILCKRFLHTPTIGAQSHKNIEQLINLAAQAA
jgi:SRSO17 transposase